MTLPVTTTTGSSAGQMEYLILAIFWLFVIVFIGHSFLDHRYNKSRAHTYLAEADCHSIRMDMRTNGFELTTSADSIHCAEMAIYEQREKVQTEEAKQALGEADSELGESYKAHKKLEMEKNRLQLAFVAAQLHLGNCRRLERRLEILKNAEAAVFAYVFGIVSRRK